MGREQDGFVAQGQFNQVLDLLRELRVERANAVKGELATFGTRLDDIADAQQRIADEQTRLAVWQREANGRTGKIETTVKMLPCRLAAAARGEAVCEPEAPPALEVTDAGVRVHWRPTRRQVTLGGAVVGGMLSWQAIAWAWPYVKAVLAHLVR